MKGWRGCEKWAAPGREGWDANRGCLAWFVWTEAKAGAAAAAWEKVEADAKAAPGAGAKLGPAIGAWAWKDPVLNAVWPPMERWEQAAMFGQGEGAAWEREKNVRRERITWIMKMILWFCRSAWHLLKLYYPFCFQYIDIWNLIHWGRSRRIKSYSEQDRDSIVGHGSAHHLL